MTRPSRPYAVPALVLWAMALSAGLAIAAVPGRAAAQQIPSCTAAVAGALTCLQNTLCECRYDRGGRLSGQPAGWRWDCDILRPRCGATVEVPATINPYTGGWPNSVVIDRSTETTTITNENANTNTNQQQTGDGTITGGTVGGDISTDAPAPDPE